MGPNMPVSCESDSAISSTIRDSLVNYNSITKASSLSLNKGQLGVALKQSLLKKIEYVEAPPGFGYSTHEILRAKYTVLRPLEEEKSSTVSTQVSTLQSSKSGHGTKVSGACIPSPKQILFPKDKVQIGWGIAKKWSVGSGMVNLGNTCYLNSTLQALFHVPSLANWLLSDAEHRNQCEEQSGSQNGCIICSMGDVLKATQSSICPIKPFAVFSKLRQICRHLVHGHQEDAHEFLRYLMESMEKAYLARFENNKEFEQYTKETTPINQILGGYLRTSVKCLSCQYESVTFQHFEDLLLDIRKVNTIEDALKYHFARERLEDMDYTCESCKKKVSATKQFSVERAPVALCIQLKRFSGINGKISKHINISQEIDFSQYSSKDEKNSQLKYRLVSMITHLGSTPQCGHYTAIGCVQDGSYYQFDDSSVRTVSISGLLNTNPYIIFYELIPPKPSPIPATTTVIYTDNNMKRTETSTQLNGRLLPVTTTNQLDKPVLTPINGCLVKRTYGSPINGFGDNRKLVSVSSNQVITPHKNNDTVTGSSSSPTAIKSSSTVSENLPNETLTKNVNKSWIRVEYNSDSVSSRVQPSIQSAKSQSPTKRDVEVISKTFNETLSKKSEDSKNSLSSDFETGTQSSLKIVVLPSMPDLKSPVTQKPDENIKSSNGTTVMNDSGSNLKRPSDCDDSTLLKVTTAPSSPRVKPTIPRVEEIKKSMSPKRESSDIQQRLPSISSLNSLRTTINPFSRNNNTFNKNTKHKTNGFSHNTYNQRNSKSTNGYVRQQSLVPYQCNEDSDSNNEDRKSPPIVKTKAGPFQVTKNTANCKSHWISGEQRLPWSNSNTPSSGIRVPSLNTWNGSKSFLQDDIATDQREHRKRKLEKDVDSDLDCGQIKKKRRLVHNQERDNPNYNAFQEHQNQQQRDSNRYRRGYGHYFSPHRFQNKCYNNKRKY